MSNTENNAENSVEPVEITDNISEACEDDSVANDVSNENDNENESAADNTSQTQTESEKKPAAAVALLDRIRGRYSFGQIFSVLVIAGVFIAVAYYLLFPSRGYFHADCTDTMVWAAATYESGHIFDPDCGYACLLPFGGSLLMLPFYGLFGFSMTTHLIGMFLFMVIFGAFLLLMLKEMKWSLPWTAVAFSALMLTLSISEKLREIFWGHTIYYSLGILFIFVGLFIFFRLCNKYEKVKAETPEGEKLNIKKFIIPMTAVFVWFFLCATNKIMTITIFTIPVMAAIFLERFFDVKSKIKENMFYGVVLVVAAVGTIGGYVASTLMAGDIVAGYEDAYSTYSNPDEWLTNLQKFPLFWLKLLGVEVTAGEPLMSVSSVLNLIKIVAALLLVAIPILAACFYPKIKDRFTRILIIVHWMVFALIMMGFVFGMLSAANWRLSPIVCTSVLVTVAFGKWIFESTPAKRVGGLLVVPQIVVAFIALSTICGMPYDYGQDEGLYAVADFLKENDLDYGYATFWNANSVTAISNNAVKVRSISDINDNTISVRYYQSRKPWYVPKPDQDKFFLLLTDYEYSNLVNLNNSVLYLDHEVLDCNEYTVLVFNQNII